MNRPFVREALERKCSGASGEKVSQLIDAAENLLGNLVHYHSGRSHYDEDVITVAFSFWNSEVIGAMEAGR
jgi:hypothetical protein